MCQWRLCSRDLEYALITVQGFPETKYTELTLHSPKHYVSRFSGVRFARFLTNRPFSAP